MKYKIFLFTCLVLGLITACSTSNKELEISVMSFNVRYDNPEDGSNNWNIRKTIVGEMLSNQSPDLIGTQEVLNNQLFDLKELLPNYNAVGVGREDGMTEGEYSAIFYNKNKFTEVDSGTFWLSETPDVIGSRGWDGACERVATWVRLIENKSNKEFLFINTHLDHIGVNARKEGVNLLQNKAFELSNGLPIIATGDFNAEPDSDVIENVVNPNKEHYWDDSRAKAFEVKGLSWTFHDFDQLPIEERELIDYVFVSPNIKVAYFEVLPIHFNERLVSDHAPIIAKLVL